MNNAIKNDIALVWRSNLVSMFSALATDESRRSVLLGDLRGSAWLHFIALTHPSHSRHHHHHLRWRFDSRSGNLWGIQSMIGRLDQRCHGPWTPRCYQCTIQGGRDPGCHGGPRHGPRVLSGSGDRVAGRHNGVPSSPTVKTDLFILISPSQSSLSLTSESTICSLQTQKTWTTKG